MFHIYDLDNAQPDRPSIVTIGVFDGVHRGHQYLISHLVERAREANRRSVALTLFPHPDLVIRGQKGRYYLTTPEQKASLLRDLGVDLVVTHPFNEQVRNMRAADFVDSLIKNLDMKSLWVTADFALGYKREGNFEFLQAQGAAKGFEVVSVDLLSNGEQTAISSTAIREALLIGQIEMANHWIGRQYALEGKIIHGDHRGRTIGFPTANMEIWSEQVVPANGVYACYATLNGEKFRAVTNVGERPTFNGTGTRVEAYLLDFDRDIYGETLKLEFVTRLRGEQKFGGIDALVAQIRADVEKGRTLLPVP